MTPLERAARALCEAQGCPATPNEVARAIDEVRAVLEAIREPSEAMIRAGEAWQQHCSDVDSLFSEMVKVAIFGPEA